MHVDLIIIALFLIATIALGLYHSRGIKTLRAYAVGGRKMSTMVITLSLIATTYDGSILSSRPESYYRLGVYAFMIDLASAINFYLAARFVTVRMKEFLGHLSIAESMGSVYGSRVRMCTGILGIMMSIALLAAQIKFGLTMSTVLFPEITQHANLVVVCLIVLVIGYSTCGGVRSVAFTDVYQFFLFCLCFPTLFFILIYYGNPSDSYRKLSTMPQFDLGKLLAWNGSLKSILIYYVYRSVFPFDPGRIQRFYMASSIDKAAKIFSRSAMIRVFLSLSFLGLAIALYVGGHIIKPMQNVVHYIIGLAYFPGMRGMLVTAIIALLMSTADSNLHAASVLFTNDIWPVFTKTDCTQR